MKRILLCIIVYLVFLPASAGELDRYIDAALAQKGIPSSPQSDPARLVRRTFLVVTDRIPTSQQTAAYLRNPDRIALVDSLLASEGFVEKQVLKWGDLLRIKSEFPSCMWPNAVQAFNKWLGDAFRANMPYDAFVRSLLLSTGSNFRVPQTNFYRAGNDRSPAKFSADAALLFLGRRKAPVGWEPFFAQVKFKSTKEWKEEILCLNPDAEQKEQAILDGRNINLEPGTDWRQPLAEWLTSKQNRDFARAFANRLWAWLMGRGIIDPCDDMDGGHAPVDAAVLDYLTDRFIASGFDVRALAREILLSDAFSRSTLSVKGNEADDTGFSHYRLDRLTSEQLCDAICDITEIPDLYSSRAPEPFTNFPAGTRANQVCDGTITTPQLDLFGRPSRDVALESSRDNTLDAKQILYLLNSTVIQDKLTRSPYMKQIAGKDRTTAIKDIYMRVLSRPATREEISAFQKWTQGLDPAFRGRRGLESLVWALINSDEFLFVN
ncbi:MAG: DUF1553 domain-containing protein [Bacteroidales bacterium]|nr:DUF1553 domain-containing protein [Bacteroidales bacterium]